MPLYEYQCKKCERRVEKIQKYSDPPLTTCEHCGGKLKRLISSSAIQFKGSGWYVNDYARGSSPGSKNSEGSDGGGKKAEDSSKKSESAESSSSKTAEPAKAPTSKPSEPSKTSKKD